MIFLSDISTPETFNNNINSQFQLMSEKLYLINPLFSHYLRTKQYPALRAFANQVPVSVYSTPFIKSALSQLSSSEITLAEQHSVSITDGMQDHVYIYVGSKISFKNEFFSEYAPSAYNLIFNYLLNNNFIRPIGPGQSSVILVSSSIFSEDIPFPSELSNSFNSQNYLDSFNSLLSNYSMLQADNDFLKSIIDQKDAQIQHLYDVIHQLEHQNYVTSQMTWR